MNKKLTAFQCTHTWDFVPLPTSANPVSRKWIYKIKIKPDDSVEWHKAHLIARGFTQEYGIDYEETFAPMAKITSILALVPAHQWPPYQIDVKNTFLNGDLSEVIYM